MSARLHMLGCDGAHARRSDNQTSRKKLCGCEEECPGDRCRSSIADGDKLQPTVAQAFCQSRHTSGD